MAFVLLITHLTVLLCVLGFYESQAEDCMKKTSCETCATADNQCVWCRDSSDDMIGTCVSRTGNTCAAHLLGMGDERCTEHGQASVCSGHGECVCGQCHCKEGFSGRYCDCDNLSCDYYQGQVCGGPDRGVCSCGSCVCNSEYKGTACACARSVDSCMAVNGLVCNGKGNCVCGECTCDALDTSYYGPRCEDCSTCIPCERYKDCVMCKTFNTGRYSKEGCPRQCSYVETVDVLNLEDSDMRLCKFKDDEDDCVFSFAYSFRTGQVKAQRTKECSIPTSAGTNVAIGLTGHLASWLMAIAGAVPLITRW